MDWKHWSTGLQTIGDLGNFALNAVNLGLGIENRNYMRRQHERMLQREDTAVQRRVADLEAAGLHPALAAGSGAQTHAPVASPQPSSQMQELQTASLIKQIQMADAEIAYKKAGADHQSAEAQFTRTKDSLFEAQHTANIGHIGAQTDLIIKKSDWIDRVNQATVDRAQADINQLNSVRDEIVHNLIVSQERGWTTRETHEVIRLLEYIDKQVVEAGGSPIIPEAARRVRDIQNSLGRTMDSLKESLGNIQIFRRGRQGGKF